MACTSMDVAICRRKFEAQMVSSSRSPSERHWKLGGVDHEFFGGV